MLKKGKEKTALVCLKIVLYVRVEIVELKTILLIQIYLLAFAIFIK